MAERSQVAASPRLARGEGACAYLVAGHVVGLLDDIDLVQEAGRVRDTRGGQSPANRPRPPPQHAGRGDPALAASRGLLGQREGLRSCLNCERLVQCQSTGSVSQATPVRFCAI